MKYLVILIILCHTFSCLAEMQRLPEPGAPDGYINGHAYVNLGLPSGTLWATHNIGASSPHEYGDYFAWGEVSTKDEYTSENYEFVGEFIDNPRYGCWFSSIEIGDEISGTEYDVARKEWGAPWRLPTEEEAHEFVRYTWFKWLSENDVNGVRIVGRNEHSIFLPATGYALTFNGRTYFDQGRLGCFWTGTQSRIEGRPENYNSKAATIDFDSGCVGVTSMGDKAAGKAIRPVTTKKELSGIYDVVNNLPIYYENGHLKIVGNTQTYSIDIFDVSGREVFHGILNGTDGLVLGLSTGIYILSLSKEDACVKTQKVIIK